jgi:hypothetical protein
MTLDLEVDCTALRTVHFFNYVIHKGEVPVAA